MGKQLEGSNNQCSRLRAQTQPSPSSYINSKEATNSAREQFHSLLLLSLEELGWKLRKIIRLSKWEWFC